MWIKRAEYEALRERKLTAEFLLEAAKERILGYQQTIADLRVVAKARILELEAALLAANDAAHKVRQEIVARPPVPVNIAALFDDEDPELVEADRRHAQAEGTTDGLLAAYDHETSSFMDE